MAMVLVLAACGDKDDTNKKAQDDSQKEDYVDANDSDMKVGFNMDSEGNIEEATNVPKDVKADLVATFDTYITTLNNGDIDGYLATLSQKAQGFNYDEEKHYIEQQLQQSEITTEASKVTIVKYDKDKNEAQVFAQMATDILQKKDNVILQTKYRQVTVMVLEDDGWKVSSIFKANDAPPTTKKAE